MLRGNPNVFPYTTYATANKLFASHPIWQTARMETERKLIFEEHVNELREREVVCLPTCLSFDDALTCLSVTARATGCSQSRYHEGGEYVQGPPD